MKYLCPVCGYTELLWPPKEDVICPCCCTQFGLDDYDFTHEELRSRWITAGAQWWSAYLQAPQYWTAISQLSSMGYALTREDLMSIVTSSNNSKLTSTVQFVAAACETPAVSNTMFNTLRTSYDLAPAV